MVAPLLDKERPLPLERPLRQALQVYLRRLLVFVCIVCVASVACSAILFPRIGIVLILAALLALNPFTFSLREERCARPAKRAAQRKAVTLDHALEPSLWILLWILFVFLLLLFAILEIIRTL
jgi:hypothetical protein